MTVAIVPLLIAACHHLPSIAALLPIFGFGCESERVLLSLKVSHSLLILYPANCDHILSTSSSIHVRAFALCQQDVPGEIVAC
jgi:hypothetical protein